MSDWWRDFFDERYIDLYGTEDASRSEFEAESVAKLLSARSGARILDLCCGYGRHAIRLARMGFSVVGLDLSRALLRKARGDAVKAAAPIDLVRADMRDLPFDSKFDIAVNIFTAFGYFEDQTEDQKVLDGVATALKPGGQFLLDTVNREWVLSRFQKDHWEELGHGRYALDERAFDPLCSRIEARTTILGGGEKIERRHSIRLYTLTEMSQMVAKAGMVLSSACGHLDGREYSIGAPRMVIVARKTC